MSEQTATREQPVDVRGPRFAAWVTTVVLAVVLLTQWWWLLAAQLLVFAIGGFAGLRYSPYSWVFRTLVAPRLSPPTEREPTPPLRFAQSVGFVFAAVGLAGFLTGLNWLGLVATALALIAALLNAAFGFCLGCRMYLLLHRISPSH
ncbi:DUF4395 domain-containing protein [Sciscionella marina]|uniref:DUF4395 domain-containing protein n=1 Tax=Sciscionella marina TaxID=508770 RepID=UPI000371ACC2|nr:DUF4395 domain-containing protein [Sciscionella marina]